MSIGNQYPERKADVARYRETIDYLRNSATTPRDSMSHVVEIKEGYATRA